MEKITLAQLLEAVNGTLLGPKAAPETEVLCVDTDSRNIHPGALFIPLVGERFDGHAYIASALENGAVGCLTVREPEQYRDDKFYVQVEDTERALRDLAVWYKAQYKIPVIAATGSVGKTTAKDMIAAVLGTKYNVLKTEGNFNNNVGLPLTVLRLNPQHEMCVLEMGMDRFGEIDYLAGAVKPDVGVITNIGDAHIERLGSRENIFKAKCELLPHVKKNGLLVLNGDDELLSTLKDSAPVPVRFCGKDEGLEYHACLTGGDGFSHINCRLTTPRMEGEVRIPALGEHMIYPTLLAVAVAEHFGLTREEIEQGLTQFVPTRMRMNILNRAEGITILDDTYNANPQSMRAAISVLADSRGDQKAAVLGDMLELGPYAPALHTGVGEYLGKVGIHSVVAVGEMARYIAEGARNSGVPHVWHCADRAAAAELLPAVVKPDSTILVKASRGMRLEELTAGLLALTREA